MNSKTACFAFILSYVSVYKSQSFVLIYLPSEIITSVLTWKKGNGNG